MFSAVIAVPPGFSYHVKTLIIVGQTQILRHISSNYIWR